MLPIVRSKEGIERRSGPERLLVRDIVFCDARSSELGAYVYNKIRYLEMLHLIRMYIQFRYATWEVTAHDNKKIVGVSSLTKPAPTYWGSVMPFVSDHIQGGILNFRRRRS